MSTLKEMTEPELREASVYLYMELARLAVTHFIMMTEIEKCVDLNLKENSTLREYIELGIYHLQQMNQRLGNFRENVALMLDAEEMGWRRSLQSRPEVPGKDVKQVPESATCFKRRVPRCDLELAALESHPRTTPPPSAKRFGARFGAG